MPQIHQILRITVTAQTSLYSYSQGVLLVFLIIGSSRDVRQVFPPTIFVFVEY